MKVLLYSEAPSPGGVTNVVATLVRGLSGEFQTHCVVPEAVADAYRFPRSGTHPICTTNPLSGWFHVPALARFFKSIREYSPTICHFHLHTPFSCMQAILIARMVTKAKIIVTEHYLSQLRFLRNRQRSVLIAFAREIYIGINFILKKLSLRWIDHTVLLSTGDHQFFIETFGSKYDQQCSAIFNGIDPEAFSPAKVQKVELPDDAKIVLTVAELNNQKGHCYLIEAIPLVLRKVPDVQFWFAGEGHLRRELEVLISQLGLGAHVKFLGKRGDVPDLLAACDLVVLPSLFEGLPLTLLEAMAAGKAVVATKVDGSTDVVAQEETGLLVPPQNSSALADAITLLLGDDSLRSHMGSQGKSRVHAAFTSKIFSEKTKELYRTLLRRTR